MRINTNLSALNAYRNLSMTDNRLNKSLERLSSGLRINRAADDAAGLAISEKMRGQIRGLNQAMRNAMDGISLMQTAEGALNETHAILQRMRELSVQAASDTLTSSDRIEIQREIEQLTAEMNRIASSTEFNTKKLLDGSSAALTSTSDLNTRIIMRDGLRIVDQFGQKAVGGGNYRLDISAIAGQGEVQKTDIMKVKHASVATGAVTSLTTGVDGTEAAYTLDLSGATGGDYTLSDGTSSSTFTAGSDGAAAIQTALEGWAGVGAGNVSVTGDDTAGYTITFNMAAGDIAITFTDDSLEGVGNNAGISAPSPEFAPWVAAEVEVWNVALDGSFRVIASETGAYFGSAGNVITVDIVAGDAADDLVVFDSLTDTITISLRGDASQTMGDIVAAINGLLDFEAETSEPAATITAAADIFTHSLGGGSDGTDEVINLDLDGATGGTYSLGDGTSTVTLNYDDDAAAIQTALETIYGPGNVTVAPDGTGGFDITFDSAELGEASGLEFANIDLEGLDESEASMVVTQEYEAGADAEQRVTLYHPEGGTFTLTFTNPADDLQHTTGDIAWDASAEDVRLALIGLTGIADGDVLVSGEEEGPWTISFQNGLAGTPIALLGIDYSELEGMVELGSVANPNTALYDIDRFWDANGNFLLEDPQTVNIVQGDGKKTSITIFGSDTIQDVEDKMNRAIHEGLEQRNYNSDGSTYVRFVTRATAMDNSEGFFTVAGTYVIQSAVTGSDGELRFSGNEGIINALSLTTIQKSVENQFTVDVHNAHTEEELASGVRIAGNYLVGVVHPNVDIKFNPMAGITVDPSEMAFQWDDSGDVESIFIHLSDNTMVFHIGANPLQDVSAAIGDMSAEALGVNNILVTNRGSANRAISQIDYAIGRVSSERAKLGAVQNRLEHTINNLGVAAENLAAAESRVRDLDFALEMVEFTRNQIMMQAGTSMLAQANMKPQSVLMLLQ